MTTSPASGESDALSELERQVAATLAADAAEYGTDLDDPAQRAAFRAGLAVSLAWITSAHQTHKIPDDAYKQINDLLSLAISGMSSQE